MLLRWKRGERAIQKKRVLSLLLDEHGWTLPTSLEELEALAPQVEAAGCELALNQASLPGYGFQYFCNIMDTSYLNTLEGRKWQNDFLAGTATMKDTPRADGSAVYAGKVERDRNAE